MGPGVYVRMTFGVLPNTLFAFLFSLPHQGTTFQESLPLVGRRDKTQEAPACNAAGHLAECLLPTTDREGSLRETSTVACRHGWQSAIYHEDFFFCGSRSLGLRPALSGAHFRRSNFSGFSSRWSVGIGEMLFDRVVLLFGVCLEFHLLYGEREETGKKAGASSALARTSQHRSTLSRTSVMFF